MFVNGDPDGYALWTNGALRVGHGEISWGDTELFDVRDTFDRVYRIVWGVNGSFPADGIAVHYMRPGYVMVAVAPDPANHITQSLQIGVYIVGGRVGSPPLPLWRAQLLQARLLATSAPELAIVAIVNAVDLFVEALTNTSVRPGRPQSWVNALEKQFGGTMGVVVDPVWDRTKQMVRMRNATAHGKDVLERVSDDLAEREVEHRARSDMLSGEAVMPPSLAESLRTCLYFLRHCRKTLGATPT